MSAAPALVFPVKTALAARLWVTLIATIIIANYCYSTWTFGVFGVFGIFEPKNLVLAAVSLLALAVALRHLRALPQGSLRWDGEQWFWQDQAVHLTPLFDAQRYLLLRLVPLAGDAAVAETSVNATPTAARPLARRAPIWLHVQRRHSPAQWLDLRRAVFDRQRRAPSASLSPSGHGV